MLFLRVRLVFTALAVFAAVRCNNMHGHQAISIERERTAAHHTPHTQAPCTGPPHLAHQAHRLLLRVDVRLISRVGGNGCWIHLWFHSFLIFRGPKQSSLYVTTSETKTKAIRAVQSKPPHPCAAYCIHCIATDHEVAKAGIRGRWC